MKWVTRVCFRADYADHVNSKKMVQGYLWELHVAGLLWEWRRV